MRHAPVIAMLFVAVSVTSAVAVPICLNAEGEAAIVNNDLPSAKAEAIARAKWVAVEKAVGLEVKAQSVVQNMALVDEAISKQVNGVVSRYTVLQVNNGQDAVTVKVNACVEPVRAKDALAGLALNNSIAVFIPSRKPGNARGTARYEEANILSEALIGRLTEQGYTVVDIAPTKALDAAEMDRALKNGNFLSLRSLTYKFLANVLLIGKVDYTVSTRKGEHVGYGIAMPFNSVTVRLTYRLVTRDSSGKMVVLSAGTEEGKGLARSVEDAAAEGLKELAEKTGPVILDKVGSYIKGVAKKIEVKVDGVTEVSDSFAVKEVLQNLAWVTKVEERGLGEFVVSYPENPVYLASSISQKGSFHIEKFTPYAISLKYLK
jgi:hypothetical protein